MKAAVRARGRGEVLMLALDTESERHAAGLRGATVEVLSSAGEVIARTRSRKQGLFAVRFEPGTPSPAALRVTARRHCGLEWPIEETPSTGRCLRVVIVRQQR